MYTANLVCFPFHENYPGPIVRNPDQNHDVDANELHGRVRVQRRHSGASEKGWVKPQ